MTASPHPAASLEQLIIESRTDGDSVTLILRGEIDIGSGGILERELLAAEASRPRRIVLDLAALDFIDSTGIHLLIRAHLRADTMGHELVLVHVPYQARRLFDLTRASNRLNVA